jgi:hypothetical protein
VGLRASFSRPRLHLRRISRNHFPEMVSRRWSFGKAKVAAIGPSGHPRSAGPLPAPLRTETLIDLEPVFFRYTLCFATLAGPICAKRNIKIWLELALWSAWSPNKGRPNGTLPNGTAEAPLRVEALSYVRSHGRVGALQLTAGDCPTNDRVSRMSASRSRPWISVSISRSSAGGCPSSSNMARP